MKPRRRPESFSEPLLSELEARLAALETLCASEDPVAASEARGKHALLKAEVKFREAREKVTVAEVAGQDAGRYAVTLTVSSTCFARLESLARCEGRLLQEIVREAVLKEADRLERKAMVDASGEGRVGLSRYRKARRKVKEIRRG